MSESKKLYVSVGSRCAMKAAVGSELIMLIVLFSFAASSGIMESLLMVIQSVGYF